jgi:Beta-lactamase
VPGSPPCRRTTSAADITSKAEAVNARLTTLESYTSNGETLYAFIMIANTGADAKEWWWHANVSAQTITASVSRTNSRILDLTPAGNGNFNAVMESCSGGCPAWWWYAGLSPSKTLEKALDHGARIFSADPYPGCGSNCLAAVMISNTPADIVACDPAGCMSEAKLSENICNTLDNQVGYVCLVGGIRPRYGGLARTSADPPQTGMTPDLVTDVASVSKTLTATGILQLLAADGLTPDAKISPYLYPDWVQGNNIQELTFRELLTHTSGFGQVPSCSSSFTYEAVEQMVAGGVSQSNIGQPQYGNCNFSLLRELMPALLGQPLTRLSNGPARAAASSALYIAHMQSAVFEPAGVTDSSCTPPTTPTGILSYPYPAGSTQGYDWGDFSQGCGAAGWVLSAFDIFKVVSNLANGNVLLSDAERQAMKQGCLGWDCAVRNDCPTPYVCKNGAFPSAPLGDPNLWDPAYPQVWTYAGILKCNVPVVVIVNSPLPSPYEPVPPNYYNSDIIGVVENAYELAQVPGTPQACPN